MMLFEDVSLLYLKPKIKYMSVWLLKLNELLRRLKAGEPSPKPPVIKAEI